MFNKISFLCLIILNSVLSIAQTYNMNDSGTTESTCSGIFYDPEGISNYVDHDGSYTMTFQSATGTQLQFDFTSFSTNETNDHLEIYDGQTTAATFIGDYSETNSPGIITSTGEYLTFVWTTDNNHDGNAGWEASISCVPVPANDECANAITLPCATTDLAGTTINAVTQTNGTGCSLGSNGAWYTFTGDGVETTISSTAAAGFDHEMAIASGSCGALSSVSCNDSDYGGGTESYTFTPTNGTDYYVYIAHYSSNTMDDFTISRSCACVTNMTLAANQPAASSLCAGSLKQAIQSFSLDIAAGCDGELTNLNFTTTGSYQQLDIIKYQLWYNSSNDLSTASQLGFDIWSSGTAGLRNFSSLSGTTLSAGNTYYFWITADLSETAVDNNTIAVNAISPSDINAPHTVSGSSNAGGIQTISYIIPPGSITSNSPQCVGTGVTFNQGGCSEGTCYWVSSSTGTETSNSSPSFTSATAQGTYDVWVRAYDGTCWSSSVTASGDVNDTPNMTSDPSDASVETGDSYTFWASADNSPDNYNWEVSTDGGSSWSVISDDAMYSNSSTSSLDLSSITLDMDGYQYRAYAQNNCGVSSASTVATLTVSLCLPSYLSGGSTDNITHVVLGSLNDIPPVNNSPYVFDQTAIQNSVPDLEPSATYVIDVTMGTESNQYSRIWIDFDQNSVFAEDESFSLNTNAGDSGTASINFTVPADAMLGTTSLRIRGGDDSSIPAGAACGASNSSYGMALDYYVNILPPSNMSFVSCTTEQNNTDDISIGAFNQEIICVKVVTTGVLSPVSLSIINIRTDGSDAYSTDIGSVNVWYTGTSSSFSTSSLFGNISTPSASGVDMSVTGSQELTCGTNYFWVSYDIPSGATDGNYVDAKLQNLIIDGETEMPVVSEPAGNRQLIDGCHYTLMLMDEWGAWSGSNLTVQVGGVDRLTNVTLSSGTSESFDFIAETGETITTIYTAGTNPEDNSYKIVNPNDAYICSSGESGNIPQNISVFADCESVKEFTMNGDTYQNGDACFIITEDKASQSGSVWSNYKIDMIDDFTIDFDVYLGDDFGGADGLVFALQGDCASSGGDGSSLGFGGISNSVGIEFDTYDNGSNNDLSNDHLAIISDGSTDHWASTNLAGPYDAGELEDDAWHSASISWDVSAETLSVSLDGSQVLSYTGDIITDQLASSTQAFWGFTGGTGLYHNLQKVCVNSYPQNTTELEDMTICNGCSVGVEAASGANLYIWTPDDGSISNTTVYNPTLSPDVTTEYTLTIEDGCGNFLTNKFTVYVGILPVELIDFSANCESNYVDISWSTASETNSSHFILERSNDMLHWNQLAEIQAAGNSYTKNDYRFQDNLNTKIRYYRLTQIDFDGNSTVYDVIAVNCAAQEMEISVYPNPCKDKFYVNIDEYANTVSIDCFNATGKLVLSKRLTNIEQTYEIDIQNLPSSVYMLVIYNETILKRVQIIKL
ncbi:MAG: T9SS type A sorting domain-containing protein [Bacteroidota bacterium]|nr:T9SS type A sorting domain-containing protein [Bacteroidota bacterium]